MATTATVDRFFEYSLLGMLASGYLAVLGSGFLDPPAAVLAGLALAWRGLMIAGLVRLHLTGRMVAVATLFYAAFYPVDYFFLSQDFLRATIHMVFFLAALRILTATTPRDFFFVEVIAFLELLAACILSANLNFFLFLGLFVLFAIATFAAQEIRRSAAQASIVSRSAGRWLGLRLGALAAWLFAGILLLTVAMFFVLPRTARAAFQQLVPQKYHLPGFSNEVVLGQLGEIKQQNTAVMRVRYREDRPMLEKWRGGALSVFDGRRWSVPPGRAQLLPVERGLLRLMDPDRRRRHGREVFYEVHVRDLAADTLFFAGTPQVVSINQPAVMRTPNETYHAGAPQRNGLLYGAYAFLEDPEAPPVPEARELDAAARREFLELPAAVDPRIARLAREWMAGETLPERQARALEQRLRREFGYTLELLDKEVPDPLAHFLFERRKGHCEYFASALAVMLRTQGIPSRIATGFQTGVFNPISGWQLIRAADAHSWVEAWMPRRGWITLDPTPPGAANAGGLWQRMQLYLDAAEVFWQDWVLSYDLDRQVLLATRVEDTGRRAGFQGLERAGVRLREWGEAGMAAARRFGPAVLFMVVLLGALVLFWPSLRAAWDARCRLRRAQRGEGEASDATVLYRRMLELLRRRGVEKPGWLTAHEFARVAPAQFQLEDFTHAYYELRFGGSREAAARMAAILERLGR